MELVTHYMSDAHKTAFHEIRLKYTELTPLQVKSMSTPLQKEVYTPEKMAFFYLITSSDTLRRMYEANIAMNSANIQQDAQDAIETFSEMLGTEVTRDEAATILEINLGGIVEEIIERLDHNELEKKDVLIAQFALYVFKYDDDETLAPRMLDDFLQLFISAGEEYFQLAIQALRIAYMRSINGKFFKG